MGNARDHGVGVCVVPQGAERFNPPKTFLETHRPGIALLLCTVEPQGGVQ
jgi:hypothetical protein